MAVDGEVEVAAELAPQHGEHLVQSLELQRVGDLDGFQPRQPGLFTNPLLAV